MMTRMQGTKTPWGRIAVAVEHHARGLRNEYRATKAGAERPDYADIGAMLEPYVKRELLLARIDEARKSSGEALTKRIMDLAKELLDIEATLPPEDRL
jgi:hypothetical protein